MADITFSAASAVGLNNPGTEIITLVKDGSGNFINPPSYDKMRAYLRSGEVPMLFVTTEGGETGSLYQLVEYSETENKIRFSNDTNAIEFVAGAAAPVVTDVGGGGSGGGGVLIVNITKRPEDGTLVADKTVAEIIAAAPAQLVFAQYSAADTSGGVLSGPLTHIKTASVDGNEMAALFFAGYWYDSKEGSFVGGIMCRSQNGVEHWSYYA